MVVLYSKWLSHSENRNRYRNFHSLLLLRHDHRFPLHFSNVVHDTRRIFDSLRGEGRFAQGLLGPSSHRFLSLFFLINKGLVTHFLRLEKLFLLAHKWYHSLLFIVAIAISSILAVLVILYLVISLQLSTVSDIILSHGHRTRTFRMAGVGLSYFFELMVSSSQKIVDINVLV